MSELTTKWAAQVLILLNGKSKLGNTSQILFHVFSIG